MRWLLWCFCLLAESYETINHYHYHYRYVDFGIFQNQAKTEFWTIPFENMPTFCKCSSKHTRLSDIVTTETTKRPFPCLLLAFRQTLFSTLIKTFENQTCTKALHSWPDAHLRLPSKFSRVQITSDPRLIFHFGLVTVFCWEYRLLKHKITDIFKVWGWPWPPKPPGYVCAPSSTCLTTTHQLIWRFQLKCGVLDGSSMECRVIGEYYEAPYFHPQHQHPPSWNGPTENSMGDVYPPPHRCRTFPFLLTQMG